MSVDEERPAKGQSVFDEVLKSLKVHAPEVSDYARFAIATDVSLKVRGFVDDPLISSGDTEEVQPRGKRCRKTLG